MATDDQPAEGYQSSLRRSSLTLVETRAPANTGKVSKYQRSEAKAAGRSPKPVPSKFDSLHSCARNLDPRMSPKGVIPVVVMAFENSIVRMNYGRAPSLSLGSARPLVRPARRKRVVTDFGGSTPSWPTSAGKALWWCLRLLIVRAEFDSLYPHQAALAQWRSTRLSSARSPDRYRHAALCGRSSRDEHPTTNRKREGSNPSVRTKLDVTQRKSATVRRWKLWVQVPPSRQCRWLRPWASSAPTSAWRYARSGVQPVLKTGPGIA